MGNEPNERLGDLHRGSHPGCRVVCRTGGRRIIGAVPPKKKAVRRKKAAPASVGLSAAETRATSGAALDRLAGLVESDGGAVLAKYSEPFGGTPLLLVALPVDSVEPTPYQRDPSDAHVKRLMGVIEKIGRFLDPIIAVRDDGRLLDAQRQPPAAGAQEARRQDGGRAARARSGDRVQDPRAEHREGAQPAREVARDDPDGARARGAARFGEPSRASRSSSSSRRS